MLRNKTSSAMQKTYDECYLVCSTATYFESQNNEAEALRSWRSALDQIYYHNAYRVPATYQPKSDSEKALQDALRDMEMRCKERVDLLEALRRSRMETGKKNTSENAGNSSSFRGRPTNVSTSKESSEEERPGWIGQGTVPAVNYKDLSRSGPPLPQRPALLTKKSSGVEVSRPPAVSQPISFSSPRLPSSPQTLPVPPRHTSRTPSPEKKGRMLRTLRPGKDGKRPSRSAGPRQQEPPAASKAATQAWDSLSRARGNRLGLSLGEQGGSSTTVNSLHRDSIDRNTMNRVESGTSVPSERPDSRSSSIVAQPPSPFPDYSPRRYGSQNEARRSSVSSPELDRITSSESYDPPPQAVGDLINLEPPTPPLPKPTPKAPLLNKGRSRSPAPAKKPEVDYLSYRNEYPNNSAGAKVLPFTPGQKLPRNGDNGRSQLPGTPLPGGQRSPQQRVRPSEKNGGLSRKPVANSSTPRINRSQREDARRPSGSSGSGEDTNSSGRDTLPKPARLPRKQREDPILADSPTTPTSTSSETSYLTSADKAWKERVEYLTKNLPKGVDEGAAKQIFNEIVVQGDEVHWDDVAGLDVAKNALKEAVVYPFLRPDLFMGLREPARGMLLFGPPGTGKTMLARAVATESKSTFFSISASSLTSKFLGESEKLVRALFSLAKALAPSIIFVDEIDSLLSSRSGSGEHEATRRIKTEFLIQWSDLARAAAGREQTDKEKEKGDASRVLVLAATNLPWAIDEAARRRFVRRQYIPLPEGHVRGKQLRTLIGHQKHSLSDSDIEVLVELTDGFSGSDITALAKDAAMGPLRSLGEALLHMSMDQIRPIQFVDFEASLVNIRPSVSRQGLREFEDWAREFGERGG
ncbi:MAG: hypothetical protein M1812_001044 [Candelaria pacifica]|nr:MAG: hypothetical protein M1812_001044 [Candelaria pacifica]